MTGHRARPRFLATALLVVLALVLASCALQPRPVPPVEGEGRWFTDATGRVVVLRGVNYVEKWRPTVTPEAGGFDDDDAALIAESGFNVVRLGVVFEFLMPEPGRIDRAYLDSITRTVRILGRHRLFVLIDFHQDGYGPTVGGNGMPDWATIIDDAPNIPASFPLYYVQNPAIQRAFDNFWANREGPDGVPLQEHYATAMREVAKRFASNDRVLGYEPMNEPWPGTDWQACATGCPELEEQLLGPFYDRMARAIRSVDRHKPIYEEPFVLFNFGFSDTSRTGIGGPGAPRVLSTHVYALEPALDAEVMARSVAAAERDDVPVIVTEWGALNDPATLARYQDQLDDHLLPWMYWSYNGHVVGDSREPLTPGNLNESVLGALTRAQPGAINGTPTSIDFDDAASTLELAYSTRRPDGRRAPAALATTISVPERRYPDGYTVTVEGAVVTSRPCASTLTLRNRPRADQVRVTVSPGGC